MPGTTLLPDRLLVGSAVVLTCVVFTRVTLDPVNIPKLAALALVTIGLLALGAVRLVRDRVLCLPASAAALAATLLALALAASAAAAPVTAVALLGTYGRNSGLIAYLCAIVLFLVCLRAFHGTHAKIIVGSVVAAGLFTATYGLLQKAGLDAIPWNNPFNPIIAALGNPNFASGYLGIAASVAAGGALYSGWAAGWRLASGVTALLSLLAAGLSASVQGPIAAAAGAFVLLFAVALDLRSSLRRPALAGLAAAAATALGVLLLGAVSKQGPAAALFSDVGSEARTHYWGAAVRMFRENPLLGVGLDQYGNFWWSARSPESVVALGPGQFSDAAHSVPLQMLAQGGLVLFLAYAAFVVVTFAALVLGLLRLRGPQRGLVAALGAGWAAYQVQSAVSIDQVPLIVLHFTLAGALIAAAGHAGLRELRLPGAPPPPKAPAPVAGRKKARPAAPPTPRQLTGADAALLGLIAVLGFAAAWQAVVPLRANAAAKDAEDARSRGAGSPAVAAYDRALDLVPSQSLYWIKKAQLFQQASPPRLQEALNAFEEAIERNPYEPNTYRAAAVIAEEQGDLDLARALHGRAVEVEPLNPDTISGAATFELRHNGAEQARQLLEQALAQLPTAPVTASLWADLGDARAVLGDRTAARAAYERALALDPASAVAVEGLQKLRR